jgi:hypothetical protein
VIWHFERQADQHEDCRQAFGLSQQQLERRKGYRACWSAAHSIDREVLGACARLRSEQAAKQSWKPWGIDHGEDIAEMII